MVYFKFCFIMSALIASASGSTNIVTNTSSTSVTYGSSVRLTCTISPITFFSMSWIFESTTQTDCNHGSGTCLPSNREKGRHQFSTNITSSEYYYDISDVQPSDEGAYTCRHGTSSQQGYEEFTYNLVVGDPIESVTMSKPITDIVTVIHNTDTPEFVCVTSASLLQASISWYLDNPSTTGGDVDITSSALAPTTTTESNGLVTTSRTLTYKPSKTYNGWGVYCTATYTGGSTKTSARRPTLNVQYKPTAGNMTNESIVELTTFSKTCNVTLGNPTTTTYIWTRSTDGWNQTSITITFSQLQREDAADYTCTAKNTMNPIGRPEETGQDSNTFTLKTLYKPDVEVTTTNTSENASSAEIQCVAAGVPDEYTYLPWIQTWIDGTVINHEAGLGNLPTLRLSDLNYRHSGVYTCTVQNGVTVSRNPDAGLEHVYLLVRSRPIITNLFYNNEDHYKISVGLNDPSNLDLEYYSNAGDTTVKVENGGQVVVVGAQTSTTVQLPVFTQTISAPGITVTISVNIEKLDQFGRYEVVLQNSVNTAKFNLVVAAKQPPEVSTMLTSSEVKETTVTLTWIRGFHGGSDQTFVVQLSTDNINWSNKTTILDGQKDSNTSIKITLDNLSPGTIYFARVYSFNQEGRQQEYSNVHFFTTMAVTSEDDQRPLTTGGIIGVAVAVVVVILLVTVIVMVRKYDIELSCKKKTDNVKEQKEQQSHDEDVAELKEYNLQAPEQVSYYNIGSEREYVQLPYESLSNRDVSPNTYSSLDNIEMSQGGHVDSTPVKEYENLII